MTLSNILQLIRIKDWFKNLIIFFPIIFSGKLLEYSNYFYLLIGFIFFSFVCSLIYILNDIIDRDKDKKHPIKKNIKPLASGLISMKTSIIILITLIIISLLGFTFNNDIRLSILMYVGISLLYIFFVKYIPYAEFLFLPLVYVIRIDLGSNIINIESSNLMLICTYLISTFFILLKRIGELNLFQNENEYNSRKVLKYYSTIFLKIKAIFIAILLFILITQYIYFQNIYLLIILPMIILFLARYYLITNDSSKGEFPINSILNDKILVFLILITFVLLLFIYI